MPCILALCNPKYSPITDGLVDRHRHTSCQVSSDPATLSLERSRRSRSAAQGGAHRQPRPPLSMEDNSFLVHRDLTKGNKFYLWNIAKVYDVAPLKRQKQQQYEDLLTAEHFKGLY